LNILINICARGGSKGIPGKNIRKLNGKELIGYSIEIANEFSKKIGAKLALSTDSNDIKSVAKKFGLESNYTRPDFLATDKAGKIGAIEDLLHHEEMELDKKFDLIIDLDVTSPLRNLEDLISAKKTLLDNKMALNIFSVSPASRNPYFNMVQKNDKGFFELVVGGHSYKSRQESPKVYDMNASFYIFRREFFEEEHQISITDRSLAYIVPHLCFDLDEPVDFLFMEYLIQNQLLDFKL
jgi:CMP-N-acetylneuraminic acid synthetase